MKQYVWDEQKNEKLIRERGVSFEDMIQAIAGGGLLDIIRHPNTVRYPHQNIYVVRMAGYIYLVPHEEIGGKIRLMTIIPSRKARRKYFPGGEKP
jgi:uncharacterized DUF497 family protein